MSWKEHTEALKFLKAISQPGKGLNESTKIYNEGNKNYDHFLHDIGYTGSRKGSEMAEEFLGGQKDLNILDVGAGTGQVGVELRKLGFSSIDAVDSSQGMLDVARSKNVYGQLVRHTVGESPLPFEDGAYDAVVTVGAFVDNHIPLEGLKDIISRVVKKGGYIINVFREPALRTDYYKGDLGQYMSQLEAQGL